MKNKNPFQSPDRFDTLYATLFRTGIVGEPCEYKSVCRTREAYPDACPELGGRSKRECPVRKEYLLISLPEDVYDAKLKFIQNKLERERGKQ